MDCTFPPLDAKCISHVVIYKFIRRKNLNVPPMSVTWCTCSRAIALVHPPLSRPAGSYFNHTIALVQPAGVQHTPPLRKTASSQLLPVAQSDAYCSKPQGVRLLQIVLLGTNRTISFIIYLTLPLVQ